MCDNNNKFTRLIPKEFDFKNDNITYIYERSFIDKNCHFDRRFTDISNLSVIRLKSSNSELDIDCNTLDLYLKQLDDVIENIKNDQDRIFYLVNVDNLFPLIKLEEKLKIIASFSNVYISYKIAYFLGLISKVEYINNTITTTFYLNNNTFIPFHEYNEKYLEEDSFIFNKNKRYMIDNSCTLDDNVAILYERDFSKEPKKEIVIRHNAIGDLIYPAVNSREDNVVVLDIDNITYNIITMFPKNDIFLKVFGLLLNEVDVENRINKYKKAALDRGIPIITDEVRNYLMNATIKKRVREIGAAVGYSTFCMSIGANFVYSLEKNADYINIYLNLAMRYSRHHNFEISFVDALTYDDYFYYDIIFIDGAKAKYMDFFNKFKNNLDKGGIILIDNMFFHHLKKEEVSKNTAKMITKLEAFKEFLLNNEEFDVKILDIGDGLAVCTKKE